MRVKMAKKSHPTQTRRRTTRRTCVSPTQVRLYLQNPAEWRAIYLERSKRHRPVIGDIIGAEVHRLLAAYLRAEVGVDPPGPSSSKWGWIWQPHAIAAGGLQHLPAPGSVEVEVRRVFEIAGVPVVCVKDAEAPGLVLDHKTGKLSSALEALSTDVQAVIYAAEHLRRTGLGSVELRWIWYAIDGSGSRVISQIVDHEDIAPTIALVEGAIRAMESER
jgi:hypothetical protein